MRGWLCLLLLGCQVEVPIGEDRRGIDDDGDGYAEVDGDCDDEDPSRAPNLPEGCDGRDNDCDGVVDEDACSREDRFDAVAQLDLLLVVDRSESMREERGRLANGVVDLVPHLAVAGADVHIGVVASDLSSGVPGELVSYEGARWTGTSAGLSAGDWLAGALDPEVSGGGLEQSRAAAFAAIELEGEGLNIGFRRSEADLALLLVSDEDDHSTAPSLDGFLDWLDGAPGLDRTTVHGIVSTELSDPCGSGEFGRDHLDLIAAAGGTYLSVCELDYGPFLSGLGQFVLQQALPRRFPLADPADPATIEVEVRLQSGFVDVLDTSRFVYDPVAVEVVIVDDQPPSAGSAVQIRYQALPL